MHEGEYLFHEARACEVYVTKREIIIYSLENYIITLVGKANLQLHSVVHADVKHPKYGIGLLICVLYKRGPTSKLPVM